MKKMCRIILLVLVTLLITPASYSADAPDIAAQPCDTEYWKQMSARAWMEAEREIMQNQNLIFKADSVLEYTCFDQFVSIAAWQTGNIFSHTSYFGTPIISRDAKELNALQNALAKVVSDTYSQYLDGAFKHDFLGGRASFMDAENSDANYKPATEPVGYTCKEMSNVWQAAKCANFIDNSEFDTDGFFPLESIKGHNGTPDVEGYDSLKEDPRKFPTSCIGTTSTSGGTKSVIDWGAAGSWSEQLKLANNDDLYPFQVPLAEIYELVGDRSEPGNCKDENNQPLKAIPTGILVYTDAGHLDGVCTNPGCKYQKGSTTEVGTCVAN